MPSIVGGLLLEVVGLPPPFVMFVDDGCCYSFFVVAIIFIIFIFIYLFFFVCVCCFICGFLVVVLSSVIFPGLCCLVVLSFVFVPLLQGFLPS
uniref:Uncharacterized protein n=1 Tax=Amphimedon queenslandica TaxID=400682 RepID=A0A1X7V427_AMPQE